MLENNVNSEISRAKIQVRSRLAGEGSDCQVIKNKMCVLLKSLDVILLMMLTHYRIFN